MVEDLQDMESASRPSSLDEIGMAGEGVLNSLLDVRARLARLLDRLDPKSGNERGVGARCEVRDVSGFIPKARELVDRQANEIKLIEELLFAIEEHA